MSSRPPSLPSASSAGRLALARRAARARARRKPSARSESSREALRRTDARQSRAATRSRPRYLARRSSGQPASAGAGAGSGAGVCARSAIHSVSRVSQRPRKWLLPATRASAAGSESGPRSGPLRRARHPRSRPGAARPRPDLRSRAAREAIARACLAQVGMIRGRARSRARPQPAPRTRRARGLRRADRLRATTRSRGGRARSRAGRVARSARRYRAAACSAPASSRSRCQPRVVRRALLYAVVVGSVLIAINHGDALLAGQLDAARCWKMGAHRARAVRRLDALECRSAAVGGRAARS